MDSDLTLHDWFDTCDRVKTYPCTRAARMPDLLTNTNSRKRDDIDIDDVRGKGPTQPDQRTPCRWSSFLMTTTYDDAIAVLEDAVNRFTDLCRVSFCESGLQLSGPRGDRIVWPVRDILRQKTSLVLYSACIMLSARLYELIEDYNSAAEVIGAEHAMLAVFERVQEPDGLAPAVWTLVRPGSTISEICTAIRRADKLAESITQSSPYKTAEWERAKAQLSGVVYRKIEDAVANLSGEYRLPKAAVVMVALASSGCIWNTDPQTKSILAAMCPGGVVVGDYYPLSIGQRTQLYVRREVGKLRRVFLLDGLTWITPAGEKNTTQGLVTLYRRANSPPVRSIGLIWKRNPELDVLTEEMAQALQALSDVDKPWGRELHTGLRNCNVREVSPIGHEVAKVVAAARDAWKGEYGITDPAVEGIMGAVSVVYSFINEPDDARRFSILHCSRCFRLVSPHTTIDSVPLYKWDAMRRDGKRSNSSAREQVAKRVAEMTTSVTRSVKRVEVLPYKMGVVREWRWHSAKSRGAII